jgi:hypothetical protein
MRAAIVQVSELAQVGAAGRGVAIKLDRAWVGGLHEVVRDGLPPLAEGADLLRSNGLDVPKRDPHSAVGG